MSNSRYWSVCVCMEESVYDTQCWKFGFGFDFIEITDPSLLRGI
jgi:hypothetical protein